MSAPYTIPGYVDSTTQTTWTFVGWFTSAYQGQAVTRSMIVQDSTGTQAPCDFAVSVRSMVMY
jgi:hypothetical protein